MEVIPIELTNSDKSGGSIKTIRIKTKYRFNAIKLAREIENKAHVRTYIEYVAMRLSSTQKVLDISFIPRIVDDDDSDMYDASEKVVLEAIEQVEKEIAFANRLQGALDTIDQS